MNAYVRKLNGERIIKVEGDARTVWKDAYRCARASAQVMASEYSFRPYPTYIPGSSPHMFQYKRVCYSKEQGLRYYA